MTDEEPKEMDIAKDQISIQLRESIPYNGYGADVWPLATLSGGIEAIKIRRRGSITTIAIKSPKATVWCEDVSLPRQQRSKGSKLQGSDASLSLNR